jgi:hypothetical protein
LVSEQPARPRRRLRWYHWVLLVAAGLSIVALAWLGLSTDAKIVGLRNIISYKLVHWLGGPQVGTGKPPGSLAGTVRDGEGQPIAGAQVVVASPLGDTYAAETGPDGRYRIAGLPPGRYVPVAAQRGFQDAAAGRGQAVTVRPDSETQEVDFVLPPASPLSVVLDDSLVVSPTVEVGVTAPLPGRARRTQFSFERDGLTVNDCWLYEPVEGEGPFPTLLLVLPGPVLGWEIIPVPFAAQGFSVLACYPLRGTNIDGDAADLMTALEYLRQGRLPSRADPEQLGLIGASFTSLHSYRLLGLTDQVDVSLVLGGMVDGFRFRHDVETGAAHTRPPFDQVLMGLGWPNLHPELYFRYSAIFHLEGYPPLCILHGKDDELVPFSQSVELDAELTRRGMPHEFYSYEGLQHYFSTSADSATTQQMFQDSLACLRRGLAGN